MKVLLISDIHGISNNLDILKSKIDLDNFTFIVLLGDLFRSIYVTEKDRKKIIDFMTKYKSKLIVVRGNCDSYDDISDIPVNVSNITLLEIDGINFYLTHGNRYNYYTNKTYTNGVLIYGHEHIPYIKKKDNMIYVNVGSISLPRNTDGKTFAIYENNYIKIYNVDSMKEIYSCYLKNNTI